MNSTKGLPFGRQQNNYKQTAELPTRKMESMASYNSTWLEAES
jgi:hypothetical protein